MYGRCLIRRQCESWRRNTLCLIASGQDRSECLPEASPGPGVCGVLRSSGMTDNLGSTASRDMLSDQQIADAELEDWRKLGQGLHARFLPASFTAAARFLAAVAEVADAAGHAPQVRMDARFVDLKLISEDAIYRDDDGRRAPGRVGDPARRRAGPPDQRYRPGAAGSAPTRRRSPRSSWPSTPPTPRPWRRCGRPC